MIDRLLLGALALALGLNAAQAQDIAAGKLLYAICAACHSTDGSPGIGPSLQGIHGRKAGTYPGFVYSRAMQTSVTVWDAKTLDAYLSDPHGMIPGNVMPFPGLVDARQRADLVAYLIALPPRRLASLREAR